MVPLPPTRDGSASGRRRLSEDLLEQVRHGHAPDIVLAVIPPIGGAHRGFGVRARAGEMLLDQTFAREIEGRAVGAYARLGVGLRRVDARAEMDGNAPYIAGSLDDEQIDSPLRIAARAEDQESLVGIDRRIDVRRR